MQKRSHSIDDLDFSGQTERQVKLGLEIRAIAQDFFQRESAGISLITITRAKITKDLEKCDIFITVLPIEKEKQALDFAKRMRPLLRTEIKKKLRIRKIPRVEVKIDEGEKARQTMDTLLRKIKK